jgi:ankyrin repeat protein
LKAINNLAISPRSRHNCSFKSQGGDKALLAAVYKGRIEIVELLLFHGVQDAVAIPDSGGATPLAVACIFRFVEIVKLLLNHGAKVAITLANNNRRTPLFEACTNACMEAVKLLFEHGAETAIETLDSNGDSPIFAAMFGRCCDIVLELLAHGAGANLLVSNKQGMTPLYTAAAMDETQLVKLYLDILQTADQDQINQKTYYGMTPLFIASRYGHLEVVRLLISCVATMSPWVPTGRSLTWCCICTLSITNVEIYPCEECEHYVNNHVCSEYSDRGFRLCQTSHVRILRYEEPSWNDLMI